MAEPNWKNRTIWTGDNLEIMQGMNSCTVDLIYLDPPFNSNRNYAAPIGSRAAGAGFKDTWTLDDMKKEWHGRIFLTMPDLHAVIDTAGKVHSKGMQAYLTMMAMRLIEMKRILKETGSIYLHCDPTASHYLKMLMDGIFGKENFRNEIVWCYRGGGVPKTAFARKHDIILFYAKDDKATFNRQFVPYSEASSALVKSKNGVSIDGKARDLERGAAMPDWWDKPNSLQTWNSERTGYPTQKPLKLLDRIIRASSNEGDVVFDPFCGCATTPVAAEKLHRKWIGADLSPKAVDLVKERLADRNLDVDGKKTLMPQARVHHGRNAPIPIRTDVSVSAPRSRSLSNPKYKERVKEILYEGDNAGVCFGCRRPYDKKDMTIDHIIPQDKNGGDNLDNLILMCGNCNSIKGKRTIYELVQRLKDKGILPKENQYTDA